MLTIKTISDFYNTFYDILKTIKIFMLVSCTHLSLTKCLHVHHCRRTSVLFQFLYYYNLYFKMSKRNSRFI